MEVNQRITYFREKKHYTVNKLANLAGISQSYLRDVELGNKNPTVEMLSIICDALDITLQVFFCEAESQAVFSNDTLIEKIYRLSPKQRQTLESFLDSMLG